MAETVTVRRVKREDNLQVANIIRTVMPAFGASAPGFAIHDPEVDHIFEAYNQARCAYYVCEVDGKVVGGGGVAPLQGGNVDTCELKKMYFLEEARGKGLGQQVLSACIKAAKDMGFKYCYLETFNTMTDAMKLYERNNFKKIDGPEGNTGHFACDRFYKLSL
ncbi:GNAT family N-acetyltransferase [Chryseosolibacter indicus]|uniref:GNAT family N-acetyltransferase n=1 Tax=Chryseosolibacter indicus TaxID=2782351 RepID=A0ABS5VQH2_9BACT|nr:GNAT family N-acetyltransferase [Chryseosolibacter indicus]MBT1703100.1 GNAT family N-acetyltransferase [Chryseosolibacter indicus]